MCQLEMLSLLDEYKPLLMDWSIKTEQIMHTPSKVQMLINASV